MTDSELQRLAEAIEQRGLPRLDRIEQTLLWLAERIDVVDWVSGGGDPAGSSPAFPCSTCGHSRYDHVADGENNPWPCEYPKSNGAPVALCACGDFQAMSDDD